MDLSYEDVQNILRIVDSSSLEELHLEIGDLKLIVRKRGAGAPPSVETATGPDDGAEPEAVPGLQAVAGARREGPRRPAQEGGVEVKAPMVGTFYRAPAPGALPFVEVGSPVTEDQTVCIIEVMKLMNSIRAGCRGRVLDILAENGAMVEFGQTLMVIEPGP